MDELAEGELFGWHTVMIDERNHELAAWHPERYLREIAFPHRLLLGIEGTGISGDKCQFAVGDRLPEPFAITLFLDLRTGGIKMPTFWVSKYFIVQQKILRASFRMNIDPLPTRITNEVRRTAG